MFGNFSLAFLYTICDKIYNVILGKTKTFTADSILIHESEFCECTHYGYYHPPNDDNIRVCTKCNCEKFVNA